MTALLDSEFQPPERAFRRLDALLRSLSGSRPDRLQLAFERENGQVARADIDLPPGFADSNPAALHLVDRHVKFNLWARGAWRIHVHGPAAIVRHIQTAYTPTGSRRFDVETMSRIYGRPLEIRVCHYPADVPEQQSGARRIGGHTQGCRVGFDLGASDYKLAAVIDGEAVFTEEVPWDPKGHSDPAYHVAHIIRGIERAAAHLPRLDAVGGSSAGIIVNNQIRVASLFRTVPAEPFEKIVMPLFDDLAKKWKVPFEVANDGDVTALAGALSLGQNGILGIAMGSSEAAGFIDRSGNITGWINELAFAPVDMNPSAASDEWSGDIGVGALYFSQQVMPRFVTLARLSAPDLGTAPHEALPLPELLKRVQALANDGNERALNIYATVGHYLGHSIPWYRRHYDYERLLLLGRVTSGRGGDLLIETARRVLAHDYPEVAEAVSIVMPDEKMRRLGQAVAAASLPALKR